MYFRRPIDTRSNRWELVRRALLVLLVIASFAMLQSESVVELHAHHHGGPNDHCCPGCHSGHYPILQATGIVAIASLGISEWHSLPSADAPVSGSYRSLHSSRAPPV
jgi:hypothetical protein